jgi:hypothetical protein
MLSWIDGRVALPVDDCCSEARTPVTTSSETDLVRSRWRLGAQA